MSKTLNMQHFPSGDTRHNINSDYRTGKHNMLFTDGSYCFHTKTFGFGVHIRAKDGRRLSFHSGDIANNNSKEFERFYFEDIALNLGLKLCLQHKIKNPLVYVDSMATYSRYMRVIGLKSDQAVTWDVANAEIPFAHRERFERLWGEIREMYFQLKIPRLHLINGHDKIYGNEEADRMATLGRKEAIKKNNAA